MPTSPARSPRRRGAILVALAVLVSLLVPPAAAPAAAAEPAEPGWQARRIAGTKVKARDQRLVSRLPGSARLGYHLETGRVRFLSGTPAAPLSGGLAGVASGARRLTGSDARTKARRFVERYGALFGLEDPAAELLVRATKRPPPFVPGAAGAANGPRGATVRFTQVRAGVPVMGGELAVQLTADGEVLSVAGEVMPSAARAHDRPRIGAARASTTAARWMARESGRPVRSVSTSSEGLAHYDPRVMDDPMLEPLGRRLVWRIDTRAPAGPTVAADHRLVIVDAVSGVVLTSIGRITAAGEGPNRRVCDNRDVPGRAWVCDSPFTRAEGQGASGIADVDAVYRLMGVTYDYFFDRFGRDGIDGQGSRMKATVRYCPSHGCPWRNAEWRWGAQQATFGRGWARADDIVGHEYTHGLLDAEAPLFYHYQSGAINESYADVFGELIDLAHAGGTDTRRTRWKIAEDSPAGVLRDMRDPTRRGHPDRVRSPRWHTGTSDDGGVHRNSGVGNKAAYLMAAGGDFRGFRIEGVGRERMARVWYQALVTRLTPAANYVDLADALFAACTDLAGSDGMTLAHCTSVRRATRATQMNLKPASRAPATAPVCGPSKAPVDVFRDDLEDPDAGAWVAMSSIGFKQGWYWPQNPNNVPGWDGTWASSGELNFYAPNRGSRSDATMRMTEAVVLPEKAFLRFGHGYSFDKDAKRRYDGGIVEIKVDGGPWRGVGGLFTHGKYNGTIARGRGNPLAGRRAWTGDSRGWAKARIDLSAFAGSRVKVRFRLGSDRRFGGRGWYIDDVRIYTCAADRDPPSGSILIDGGASSTSDPTVTLGLAWSDPTTWVTRVRLSGSPRLSEAGRLLKGITVPVRTSVAWDLADTTFGGSGQPGVRRVYAQFRDAVGNWSDVVSDDITLLAP
jgi:hypothetical protein